MSKQVTKVLLKIAKYIITILGSLSGRVFTPLPFPFLYVFSSLPNYWQKLYYYPVSHSSCKMSLWEVLAN